MKRNSSKPKRRYGDAGFTLVELVVVIAVLAILAGVGAVAYNGYIDYANKGNDRALVGEIIHALELADYSDSTLFGEDGGAMVVLSKDGIKAAGATVGSDIVGALKDAFGDLESTTLSYDKWDGAPDMSVFASLGGDNTQIKAFLDYVQDSKNSASASFAEDMEEYWGDFSTLITLLNSGATVPGINISGNEDSIVKLIVDHYKGYSNEQSETFVLDWKNKSPVKGLPGVALNLATKYAFVSYAKRQPSISDDALKELENHMTDKKYRFNFSYDFMSFDWCTDPDVKTELSNLASTYATSQAEADARAYLGLMEAAAAAQNNLGDTYTDDDFISALDPYVPMVSNVLSGKTDFEEIKTLVSGLGSVICITATKENGVLSFSVSPEDADPRPEDSRGSSDGSGKCTRTHDAALTVTYDKGFTPSKSAIDICTISQNEADHTCVITIQNLGYLEKDKEKWSFSTSGTGSIDYSIAAKSDSTTTTIITVTAKSAGTVTLHFSYTSRSNTYSCDLTINVH